MTNNNSKNNANSGKVEINGKTYQTVAYRLSEFRKQYPIESGWAIETECIKVDNEKVIFKAIIKNPCGNIVATGHAEEKRDESFINKTSALENAETSAIGRALAAAGFIGSEFASVDEIIISVNAKPIEQKPVAQAEPAKPIEQKPVIQEKPVEITQQEEPKQNIIEAKLIVEKSKENSSVKPQPSLEKAEKWAWSNLHLWLDSVCPFKLATGRTWRQLGHNEGQQIVVKEKPSAPRAYLHSIESWENCKAWERAKAKVALVIGKNGNGSLMQASQ